MANRRVVLFLIAGTFLVFLIMGVAALAVNAYQQGKVDGAVDMCDLFNGIPSVHGDDVTCTNGGISLTKEP